MKIVLIEPLGISAGQQKELLGQLESMGHTVTAYPDRKEDTPTLVARAADADVVILTNLPFRGEVIRQCPNLKMISVAFTGIDHVDMAECRARGIVVCNAAGYSTNAVAELTFGLAISVLRNMTACDAATRSAGTKAGLVGGELFGKTMGIVGTGAIGLRVAEIGRAFGCKILAYSRTVKNDVNVTYVDLDTLLKESDIVSLHLPLTAQTKGLIGKDQLALMKPTAILINCARGPIVDSEALAEALKSGKLAGAGVDVFETEPPIPADHPLVSAPHTALTPHVAFATREALYQRAVITVDNVTLWLNGHPQNVM